MDGKRDQPLWTTGDERHGKLQQNSSTDEYTEKPREKAAVKFLIFIDIEEFNPRTAWLKFRYRSIEKLSGLLLKIYTVKAYAPFTIALKRVMNCCTASTESKLKARP
ncbi:hypothetical protein GCM10007984_10900 [Shewanella putrefaciens]|nr:hypothetical protein GCM10007984_10900 [Shewanella putrefaciens]